MATTPLDVLQNWDLTCPGPIPTAEEQRREALVREAAIAVSYDLAPTPEEELQRVALSNAVVILLVAIVRNCPPGPERNAAIACALGARMWGNAAIGIRRAGLARG